MNLSNLSTNLTKSKQDGTCNHLLNLKIPNISLPNQNNILLNLNRMDTFRLIIFCYPLTGHPKLPLPKNWNLIPGAGGCTSQNCSFRDNHDELIKNNSLPIGVTTQTVDEIKEMTTRLLIPYDIVSDSNLFFSSSIKLPTFSIGDKTFIKRLTLIIEQSVIKKFFYPIFPPDQHIHEVLNWLKNN